MSSGLRPAHWQTRWGECADIADHFGLSIGRTDEAEPRWLILRKGELTIIYTAPNIADIEVWLNGYGWGYRFEPLEKTA